MATKKQLNPHVDYVEETLVLLKQKIGEMRTYLDDVRWQDLPESEDREREFKFQANLLNQYVVWLSEYTRLSGMVDALNEVNKTDEKEVRKGSYRSAFADMIKNDELDVK